jgi:hypothetical protein
MPEVRTRVVQEPGGPIWQMLLLNVSETAAPAVSYPYPPDMWIAARQDRWTTYHIISYIHGGHMRSTESTTGGVVRAQFPSLRPAHRYLPN